MTGTMDLEELERRLAVAGRSNEADILASAAELLLHDATAEVQRTFARWHGAEACADAAMLLYRTALPAHGFQFGISPASSRTRMRAIATSWSRGDPCAIPYSAETPALALLRAAVQERIRQIDTAALAGCETCRGVGWYITADNRKQMCRHDRLFATSR